jgi:glucokinase
MSKYVIGIDVGGTTCKFGIVDRNGHILEQSRIPTNEHEAAQEFINDLYNSLQPMIEKVGGTKNILGIGMGAPNANYYTGTIEYAPNLKWKGIIHMSELMEQKFGLVTKLTNDANAAAVGEQMYGCAKDMRDFITITLGTGVGSGIVINGDIVLGHDGFAGELGHTIIRPGGRLHKGTNMHGSLEAYASATGVRETAIELLTEHPERESLLRDYPINKLTSESVYDCAMKGDTIANEIFVMTSSP